MQQVKAFISYRDRMADQMPLISLCSVLALQEVKQVLGQSEPWENITSGTCAWAGISAGPAFWSPEMVQDFKGFLEEAIGLFDELEARSVPEEPSLWEERNYR